MNIQDYIQTLIKWLWLIATCAVAAAIAGLLVSVTSTPVYEASVLMMANQTANTGIVDYSSLLGSQRVIETYRVLLTTQPVLEEVIADLNLPYSAQKLARRVDVHSIPDTQLLELTAEDSDPELVAEIANRIALTFLLHQSSGKQLQSIQAQENTIFEQMDALENAIEQTTAELEQALSSASLLTPEEIAGLETRQAQQRDTYAQLVSSYLNIRVVQSKLLDVVVVEPAVPPLRPIRPRTLLNTGVAGISGSIIAIVAAFAIELLNDDIETEDDVRDKLGLPSLGAIPYVKSGRDASRSGLHVLEDWGSAEAFRRLRINLEFTDVDRSLQTILITSAGPGEGKTSIAANLSATMAQDNHRVLLVDADLHRARLHQVFHVSNERGLTSLLRGDADLKDCAIETDATNLYLLPSGPTPPNASSGLLRSRRMTKLMEEFQSFADVVVFDSPPVLSSSDAIVLGSRTDGVLLVLDSRSSQRPAAVRAVEALGNVDATILGVVLNKTGIRSSHYYYHQDAQKQSLDILARLRSLGRTDTSGSHQREPLPGDQSTR